jgi:hypothetical protein
MARLAEAPTPTGSRTTTQVSQRKLRPQETEPQSSIEGLQVEADEELTQLISLLNRY